MRDRDTVKTVTERDCDFVFIQLFQSSQEFRNWFLSRLNPDMVEEDFLGVWHSVVKDSGESDIEAGFETGRGKLIVLIEDKISADKQPGQADRYIDRGEKYVQKEWNGYEICLVAPREYVSSTERDEFQNIIFYEDILKKVQTLELPNVNFVVGVLRKAIERGEKGWKAVKDEEMTSFKEFYWRLAEEKAPELQIEKPEKIPSNSIWMEVNPPILEDAIIIHKMKRGMVDLQLEAGEYSVSKLSEKIESTDFYLEKSNSGASLFIRAKVPKIEDFSTPEKFEKEISKAINKERELRKFYIQELKSRSSLP